MENMQICENTSDLNAGEAPELYQHKSSRRTSTNQCVCLEILDLEISGVHLSGDELPEDLGTAEKRLAKIKKAKRYPEEEARKKAAGKAEAIKRKESHNKYCRKSQKPDGTVKPEAKVNMTDSESRIQKTSKGYNAQAVATEDRIVIACDVVNEANDIHPLWLICKNPG